MMLSSISHFFPPVISIASCTYTIRPYIRALTQRVLSESQKVGRIFLSLPQLPPSGFFLFGRSTVEENTTSLVLLQALVLMTLEEGIEVEGISLIIAECSNFSDSEAVINMKYEHFRQLKKW